ncbi:MAG: hypothetical protein ABIY63_20955 [Fibrobacteria bacterium]
MKFYIVAQYEYRGKSYTTRSVALYGGDVFLPGSPDGGSDETYFTTAVARLRQVAPNTAYTFIQTDESRIHLSAVKIAMVKLPAGVPNAEMDMPIVNWAPSWNYYNLPFPDGIRRGPLIFFLASLACGLFPGAFVVYLLYKDSGPKGYLYQSWPGWVFGAFFVVLLTLKVYKADQKPPPEKDIDVTIPSSQIHSG